jgi:hypothetical protein
MSKKNIELNEKQSEFIRDLMHAISLKEFKSFLKGTTMNLEQKTDLLHQLDVDPQLIFKAQHIVA